jgi:hypothetical protein
VNKWQNVNYEDDLESWFFVYFGYSHADQRAAAYIKFADHEHQLNWDGIRHFKPYNLRFYLGKDPYYAACN